MSPLGKGALFAFLAYLSWGFFPIYWKFLGHVPPFEISFHRVLWAFVFYSFALLLVRRRFVFHWPRSRVEFYWLALGSLMLMSNWFLYVWAISSAHVVEASLGYFINPFVNTFLGVSLLKERLTRVQLAMLTLAGVGVLVIGVDLGRPPWIALILASTFSIYGLTKKKARVESLEGNQFESLLFVPLSLAFIYFGSSHHLWFASGNGPSTLMLLIGGGLITGLPLIFFAEAAQRLPYYVLGLFQFLSPTLQFLSGVVLFHEPLSLTKLMGFSLIWASVLILLAFEYWRGRRLRRPT
jgi:chloramphenicol-sensitive protein RarD